MSLRAVPCAALSWLVGWRWYVTVVVFRGLRRCSLPVAESWSRWSGLRALLEAALAAHQARTGNAKRPARAPACRRGGDQ